MNKYRIGISLLIIVGATIYAARRHSLHQMRTENEQLQKQVAEVTSLRAEIAQAKPVATEPTNAALSADERSELLRLRGQASTLRRDLAQATNQIARYSQSSDTPASSTADEPVVSRSESIRRMNLAREAVIALIVEHRERGKRLPATLAEAVPAGGQIAGADLFEFVHEGQELAAVKSPAKTTVLREKKPWKNGKRWFRIYAFADGHVETVASDTRDFTAWEEKAEASENP